MPRIKANKLRRLNDQEAKFLELVTSPQYSKDNDGLRRAYTDAGYAEGKQSLSNARAKMRELADHIQLRMHEKIGQHVPWALQALVDLANSAKNEMVRAKILLEILDRAGYNTPVTIEHIKDDPSDMTREELRKEITQLMKKARENQEGDLKVIEGGKK